ETLAEKRARWSGLLHAHQYHTVITQVLAEELPKYTRSTVIPTSLASIMRDCILILASAPLILTAAMDGVLAAQFRTSEVLQREYAEIQSRARIQPSIYVHLLADENGTAPSANQYLQIRDAALKYMGAADADADLAHAIDNVSPPATPLSAARDGYRKYLWTQSYSPRRAETLRRFCAGICARWRETSPLERDVPLAHPPGECGYALDAPVRLRQHRRRQSSNYVMNLAEDICAYLHAARVFPALFRMHQFVVYLIFRPEQVRVAEIFCSGLLQVWVGNGGGFNHYPAGLSNASAGRVGAEEWAAHERYVRGRGLLGENVREQKERVEE
ncbi:hypothetical protein K505DRAFT_188822, partial [Melanomma pulvis-pyrius CBS 109.77]